MRLEDEKGNRWLSILPAAQAEEEEEEEEWEVLPEGVQAAVQTN